MLAAFLALALSFAALPLVSVLWFDSGGASAGAAEARALMPPEAAVPDGRTVEPVAFGLSGSHCSFTEGAQPAT